MADIPTSELNEYAKLNKRLAFEEAQRFIESCKEHDLDGQNAQWYREHVRLWLADKIKRNA